MTASPVLVAGQRVYNTLAINFAVFLSVQTEILMPTVFLFMYFPVLRIQNCGKSGELLCRLEKQCREMHASVGNTLNTTTLKVGEDHNSQKKRLKKEAVPSLNLPCKSLNHRTPNFPKSKSRSGRVTFTPLKSIENTILNDRKTVSIKNKRLQQQQSHWFECKACQSYYSRPFYGFPDNNNQSSTDVENLIATPGSVFEEPEAANTLLLLAQCFSASSSNSALDINSSTDDENLIPSPGSVIEEPEAANTLLLLAQCFSASSSNSALDISSATDDENLIPSPGSVFEEPEAANTLLLLAQCFSASSSNSALDINSSPEVQNLVAAPVLQEDDTLLHRTQQTTVSCSNNVPALQIEEQFMTNENRPRTQDEGIQTDFSPLRIPPFKFTVIECIQSNAQLSSFTGMNTLEGFEKIACTIDHLLVRINYGARFCLDTRELLLLCMMKLKTAQSFSLLAPLFNISITTCIKYFNLMIDILYLLMKNVVRWPSRSEITRTTPAFFHKYPNTRVILDCSEVYIEELNCLDCRVKVYSHYYGGETFKFLIGIAPSGLITFITPMYGGRASDKFVVNDCGLLDLLEPGDSVMVDKGFRIDNEVECRGCTLVRPPFLGKKKCFSKEEGIENVDVARLRVHVERAIQRVKVFNIFNNTLPHNLLFQADKILTIVAGFVNLQTPIIASNDKLKNINGSL